MSMTSEKSPNMIQLTDTTRVITDVLFTIESKYASDTYDEWVVIETVEGVKAFQDFLQSIQRVAESEEINVSNLSANHWDFSTSSRSTGNTIEADFEEGDWFTVLHPPSEGGYPAPIWIDHPEQIDDLLTACENWIAEQESCTDGHDD